MSELDDLKNLWKTQPIASQEIFEKGKGSVLERLDDQRRRIRRSNVIASVVMCCVMLYLTYLSFYYKEQTALFYIAIIAVIFLSISALMLLWKRSLKKVEALSMNSQSYIDFQLKRLKMNRSMIEYSPVYGFVLGIFVNAYIYSFIADESSARFTFWIVNCTWIYIMLVGYISYLFKMKRFQKHVQPLIDELEEIRSCLS